MLITDMKRVIEQVSRDKGIEFNVLVKALEEALRSAAKKNSATKSTLKFNIMTIAESLKFSSSKKLLKK